MRKRTGVIGALVLTCLLIASIAIYCSAAPHTRLQVVISGLPLDVKAAVRVEGPGGAHTLPASQLLEVTPGDFTLSADPVHTAMATRLPSDPQTSVTVAEGATSVIEVDYHTAIPNTTVVADNADSAIVSFSGDELRLRDDAWSNSLQPGGFVVSPAGGAVPELLSAHILEIRHQDQQLIAIVENVPLWMAIPHLVLDVDDPPARRAFSRPATPAPPGPEPSGSQPPALISAQFTPGSACSGSAPSVGLTAQDAHLGVKFRTHVDYDLGINLDSTKWSWRHPIPKVDLHRPSLKVSAKIAASFSGRFGWNLKAAGGFTCNVSPLKSTLDFAEPCSKLAKVIGMGLLDVGCEVSNKTEIVGKADAKINFGQRLDISAGFVADYDGKFHWPNLRLPTVANSQSWAESDVQSIDLTSRVGPAKQISVGLGAEGIDLVKISYDEWTFLRGNLRSDKEKQGLTLNAEIGHEIGVSLKIAGLPPIVGGPWDPHTQPLGTHTWHFGESKEPPALSGQVDPHAPPLQFEDQERDALLRPAYNLQGTVAYQFDPGGALDFTGDIEAVDLLAGQPHRPAAPLWTVPPEGTPRTLVDNVRPFYAPSPHGNLVIGAVPVINRMTAEPQIEVTAVNAETGKKAWTTSLPDPEPKDKSGEQAGFSEVVAADNDAIVVNTLSNVYVLDYQTHQLRWHRTDFVGTALDHGVVSGLAGKSYGQRTPQGLAAKTGAVQWQGVSLDEAAMYSAGPGLTQFVGIDWRKTSQPKSTIVDTATGAERTSLDGSYECQFDQQSLIVCNDPGLLQTPRTMVVFDSKDLRQIRTLPESSNQARISPDVVFHGAIYGVTMDVHPTILDARTGEVIEDDSAIRPRAVSEDLVVVKTNELLRTVVHAAVR